MEISSVKVLDHDLKLLDEIDLYTALDFTRSWQSVGDFTLIVCGARTSLKEGNIIMLGNNGHKCGVIRFVNPVTDEKGTTVTVRGQTLNGFTSQRSVLPYEGAADGGYFSVPRPSESKKYVSAEEIIKTFSDSCIGAAAGTRRQLPNLIFAENQGRGIKTNWQSRYGQLHDVLQSICEYCDCGYEIYADLAQKKFVFEYSEGVDRSVSQNINSRVILSEEFESVKSISYNRDFSNYKNLAYCGGIGEGSDRTVLAVTPKDVTEIPSGFDRFEIFLDCGTLEAVETDTAISLQEEGQHRLEEYAAIITLNADISEVGSFKYEKQWDLGDMVTVAEKRFDTIQDLRVVEVRESYEPGSIKINATLGKLPKRLGRVLKSIKTPIK